MNSIRKKITVCLIATVVIALLIVQGVNIFLSYRSMMMATETMLTETAALASERITQELTAYKNVALDTGFVPELSDPDVSLEDKRAIVDERVGLHGFRRGNIVGADGISIFDGNDYSDREYVQQAMAGNVFVSEPLISKVTGELSIMVAAPLYAGGSRDNEIVGVVYFVPPETFLNDIVSSIKVSENSRAYMINKTGDTIADTTLETITVQNIENEAASDASLEDLAAIHNAMRSGQSGFASYDNADGNWFAAYAPVEGTDDWSLCVTAMQSDYLADTYFGIFIDCVTLVVAIVASIFVALRLSKSISVPMRACAERMKQLVAGDLRSPVPEVKGKDETAELSRSTRELVTGLNTIISDMSYLLHEMAAKDFDIRSKHPDAYVGDFHSILESLRTLKRELSSTMRQINASAGQVSAASDHVSSGAQALSQGSVEQASAVTELVATMEGIAGNAGTTARTAEEANELITEAGNHLAGSTHYVEELNAAMHRISTSSDQISKIIATIESIAFQTNLLALNAAVEAARAGSAGSGFAVVADEVRNLAARSDEAAKATKELIEGSIAAVSEGAEAVKHVTSSLQQTAVAAGSVSSKMETVVRAVEDQKTAISQIEEGLEQISTVVQSNSATSQQSAAASEELSGEAAGLKQMVDQFTLAEE